ncbi:hypothetical protein HaLaN_08704 [Haematococcus lacustris]|uniref:Uncharacterized protein n=1 Tax=Haematococcus lacustris TaxID=44745 RepID=A0A699ZBT8_HAELA|nr:hypothetical protein HaLaN_08704 [Haematococcus lacustris]
MVCPGACGASCIAESHPRCGYCKQHGTPQQATVVTWQSLAPWHMPHASSSNTLGYGLTTCTSGVLSGGTHGLAMTLHSHVYSTALHKGQGQPACDVPL